MSQLKQVLAFNVNSNHNDEDLIKNLLSNLPHRLRQRVMNEIYKDMEQDYELFKHLKSQKWTVLHYISTHMQVVYATENEYVYNEG